MDIVAQDSLYETIRIRHDDDICFIQIHRPDANNTINDKLTEEISRQLKLCEKTSKIVVLEGSAEVFCFGADFNSIKESQDNTTGDIPGGQNPEPLYNLWLHLATGPFITVAHVRGKANAGGVGFVAACDMVLCEEKAVFSLSELLFGLMPACVLPFLIKRMGVAKANYMTLLTQPISAKQALEWGLVDACDVNSETLLRKHLLRLRRLNKTGITRYKNYMNTLNNFLITSKYAAIEANMEVFSDTDNLQKITRFVKTGQFPWEGA
jgi:polyketide biosynthesis enoyl-CoA hydratase PksH